jgi:hypothetical protein
MGVRVVSGVMIDVRKQDGLRKRRLDVFTRATVTVPTGTNLMWRKDVLEGAWMKTHWDEHYFVIERAVDTVLL